MAFEGCLTEGFRGIDPHCCQSAKKANSPHMTERWRDEHDDAMAAEKRKLEVRWAAADTFQPAIHQKPFRRGVSTVIAPRRLCLRPPTRVYLLKD